MSYLLDGAAIRAPHNIEELTDDIFVQHTTLDNTRSRDYMGTTKRRWALDYINTKPSDYDTIKTIWDSYKANAQAKTFQSTETNYTIASTNVHIDLTQRTFSVGGDTYISDFTLVLTEA